MLKKKLLQIFLLWFCWLGLLIGFQSLVRARLSLVRPDFALAWTPEQTELHSQHDKPYLLEPFMNGHVSWDSEFYLSIALTGYNDPSVRAINIFGQNISLNYAFFPFYPFMIKMLAFPLQGIGFNHIAGATLAGVILSLLGTLGGMVALYYLTSAVMGEEAGFRAIFYLITFPSSFFFAQVYSEGLFIGLSFGSLAFLQYKKFLFAALCAVFAAWTRALGVLLVIPITWTLIEEIDWQALKRRPFPMRNLIKIFFAFPPLAAYMVWNQFLGFAFHTVEREFFRRSAFNLLPSLLHWGAALQSLFGVNSQTKVYYLIEFGAIVLGFLACFTVWKHYKAYRKITIFGLLVLLISLTSGQAQGMHRYILAMPPVFLFLARVGKNLLFDKLWTLGSILLLGMLVTLFAFDMWVG
jgi:hypothetical protein